MVIRCIEQKDIPQVVKIHMDAFDGFFLTSLGEKFLHFYYSSFLRHPDCVFMCADDGKHVLGFSAATRKAKGFNSALLKRDLLGFIKIAFYLLFTRPSALIRLAKNMNKKDSSNVDDQNYAELFSIAVSKKAQGQGIGKALLLETEKSIKQSSEQKISLTTDYNNNESTIAFYKSMGYEVMYEFVTYPDRKMYRLIKTLK